MQRVWHQVQSLRTGGQDVWVVTEGQGQWSHEDETMESDGDTVVRCNVYPSRLLRYVARALSKVMGTAIYPDTHWQWIYGAFRRASDVIKQQSIDTLIVSFGHPSALIASSMLKRRFKDLTLVIDVRDLWVGNPNAFASVRKKGPLAAMDRRIERRAFLLADAVTAVSDGLIEDLQERYPFLGKKPMRVIHNGFEDALFPAEDSAKPRRQFFVFRHVGFFGPNNRLDELFTAIARARQRDDRGLTDVKFEFIGGNSALATQLADQHGISDVTQAISYVDHGRAVELMCTADVLLLLWGPGKGTIGGKTYEYLRSNRFILALDQGNRDGRALLNETGRGKWVGATDTDALTENLLQLIGRLRAGEPLLPSPLPDIQHYSRDHQNLKLCQLVAELANDPKIEV